MHLNSSAYALISKMLVFVFIPYSYPKGMAIK